VHLGAGRRGDEGAEQADGAGAEDQQAPAGGEVRRPDRAQGVGARLDERAEGRVDVVGQRLQSLFRYGQQLRQRPR
jgi:hypothetical protein